MLSILRNIVQAVSTAQSLQEALHIIVERVHEALTVNVVSIYLVNNNKQLVLKKTIGLKQDAVENTVLNWGEGLVGLVAKRAEIVHIANAKEHENFKFFANSGEEQFFSFLGVPILHHGEVLGVLVIQGKTPLLFSQDIVNFLVTLSVQLASAIIHVTGNVYISDKNSYKPIFLQGIAGASGIAMGKAVTVLLENKLETIPDRYPKDIDKEIENFYFAVEQLKQKLTKLNQKLNTSIAAAEFNLLDAYSTLLSSDSFINPVITNIRQGNWAPGALRQTIATLGAMFENMDDFYLRTRAEDLRALGRRLLGFLLPEQDKKKTFPDAMILVGEQLDAAHLAEIPFCKIKGIVSMIGGGSSHLAILARALGIPAVLGVCDLPVGYIENLEILIDGYAGKVFIQPNQALKQEYTKIIQEQDVLSKEINSICNLPSETLDNKKIHLYVNTGLIAEVLPQNACQAEGVGLYRTEIPFLLRETFPSEKEQYHIYRQMLERFAPNTVIARTLDIGGDKILPYFPLQEDNPFLGWRGIRISLDHPEIFVTQLRALMLANENLNNLQILLPMISSLQEFIQAKALYLRVYEELLEDGHSIPLPQIGAMAEVPSIIYQINAIAREADFISIGTNDLTQYLLAVDRNNQQVAKLYDAFHPAVLRAIYELVTKTHAEGKKISICGEIAGNPLGTLFLLGIDIDSLSMNYGSIAKAKWIIRKFTYQEAKHIALEILQLESTLKIKKYLENALQEKGLEKLLDSRPYSLR